jgi:hypothetical protein
MTYLIIGTSAHSINLALYFMKKNISYEIFEKNNSIGGVFSEDFVYPDLKLEEH